MAIAVCSLSNPPTNLSTVSLCCNPTASFLKVLSHQQPSSHVCYFKNGVGLAPDNVLTITTSSPDVSLLIPASEVAGNLACEIEKLLECLEDSSKEENWRAGAALRRKKRRKRRKTSEFLEDEKEAEYVYFKPRRARAGVYLTPQEEAEYSWFLKEKARLEALKKKVEETNGSELTSSQWAQAAGISKISLDKVLINGKEAQERIVKCYRRLVVSVATAYEGKGLSLHDLIQEGSIGLIYGAKRFNPRKGCKLSTYAYWWIRQAITKAVASNSRLVRLPPLICRGMYVS